MSQSLERAIKAMETSRDCHKESHSKLGEVIEEKRLIGEDYDDERRLRTRAARRMTHCNRVLAELRAAGAEVEAPTAAETRVVSLLVGQIREMAIRDALRRAGFNFISAAMESADDLASKV